MTIEELFGRIEGITPKEIRERLIARHHILDKHKHLDGIKGIGPDSDKHVHVNIIIDNDEYSLAMAIVHQVALIAHYPNFKETEENTRTLISVTYNNANSAELKDMLKRYMGNLTDYCQFMVDGKDESLYYESIKEFMPLDIAIEIIKEGTNSTLCTKEEEKAIKTDIRMSDVAKDYPSSVAIGTDRIYQSQLINMAYQTGADIDNLPAYDNANIQRYSTALDYFFNHSPQKDIQKKWTDAKLLDKLSSLFNADCMNERLNGLLDTSEKAIHEQIKENKTLVIKALEDNIEALALSEHSRWNVERLILGFRPYTIQERFTIESFFGEARKSYRNKLKSQRVHLDLCSYRNLRRIDPGNIKYDHFLMLAIPHILKRGFEAEKDGK